MAQDPVVHSWFAEAARTSRPSQPIHSTDTLRNEVYRQNENARHHDTIDRLLRTWLTPDCGVVTTGQQVGFGASPLYCVHKAASAIVEARRQSALLQRPVVPIFWLQTEDHDVDEIRPLRTASSVWSLPVDVAARSAVAHATVGSDIDGVLDALASELPNTPFGEQALGLLRAHYRAGVPVAQAFAGVLQDLFAEHGLLVFSVRTAAAAALAAPLHAWAFEQAADIERILQDRVQAMEAAGFAPAVPLRSGCSLSFFHPFGAEGPRWRLQRHGERWLLPQQALEYAAAHGHAAPADGWATDELAALTNTSPMLFSTSALLRPLVQDSLLPTVAWIGGPAELTYMAQTSALYPLAGLRLPDQLPRRHLTWLNADTARTLASFDLRPTDLAHGAEAAALQTARSSAGDPAHALESGVLATYDQAVAALADLGLDRADGMDRAVEKTRVHIASGLEKLAERIRRAHLQQDADRMARLQRAATWLYPHGVPQERSVGWVHLVARCGISAWVNRLVEQADPQLTHTALVELP